MQEMQVQSLSQEDPLEEGMATHSSILAWKISWMEEPGRLQFVGAQRVGHHWNDWAHMHRFVLQGDQTSQSWRKSALNIHWKDWCWSWNFNTLATWSQELTYWKRPWYPQKVEGRKRRRRQKMRCLDGITDSMDMSLSKLQEIVKDKEAWHASVHWVRHDFATKQQQIHSSWINVLELQSWCNQSSKGGA